MTTTFPDLLDTPVVIGGVGGSGTRVLASCLREMNAFIGQDLNGALDDWWFIFLFRRPLWYQKVREDGAASACRDHLALHRKLLVGAGPLDSHQDRLVREAARHFREHAPRDNAYWHYGDRWIDERLNAIENRRPVDLSRFRLWGFKSPGAHVFLPELAKFYPGLRYVHLVRNGLDMAYSDNQKQALCWSWLVNLNLPTNRRPTPAESLEYWLRANSRAVELCRRHIPDRHLIVRFEDLCERPWEEVSRIADFVGARLDNETHAKIAGIPAAPSSVGRYRNHDTSVFTSSQLDTLAQLGYDSASD